MVAFKLLTNSSSNSTSWNIPLLNQLFTSCISNHIQNIAILGPNRKDELKWMGTKIGIFSVKSMYTLLRTIDLTTPILARTNLKIWKVHAIPRAILFTWKCINNVVPTRSRIGRFVPIPSTMCRMCNQNEETILHMLLECPFIHSV
ncbi:hypothetical protein FRX31_002861 [Thalictrum thalictroides]|uniref:Reverse transcriptase zinc-binding domain-containing protein n=1 Tax=Thalictrum thalictroides TaxID=46969 RepID=A0A7J6XGD3_THATH|nr:hypothetical protein FRX31_002861 [Thalictrum thalictroides]